MDEFLDDFEANYEMDDIDFDAKCKSQCAIRSANEYHNMLLKRDKAEAKCHVEAGRRSKAWAGARAADHNNGYFSSEAYAGAAAAKDKFHSLLSAKGMANAEYGLGGAIADAEANANYYSFDNKKARIEVGTARVGGGVGLGVGGVKAKVGVGVDAVKTKVRFTERQEMDASLGLNADTGLEAGWDGVAASIGGVGLAVGRNTGIMTPFGKIVFKLW